MCAIAPARNNASFSTSPARAPPSLHCIHVANAVVVFRSCPRLAAHAVVGIGPDFGHSSWGCTANLSSQSSQGSFPGCSLRSYAPPSLRGLELRRRVYRLDGSCVGPRLPSITGFPRCVCNSHPACLTLCFALSDPSHGRLSTRPSLDVHPSSRTSSIFHQNQLPSSYSSSLAPLGLKGYR